ncbi:OmpA family protein [Pseudomonas mandelii]|uniref:OmpA family protein n=1 Tax=Pseudomonas mandelii TaxID=75612 RepID=UPI00224B37E2|nr:type VI secretion system ImpA family N-terminal domain-containing protein [Pseudomonas mandelii]MCX2900413.1 type VI secretion system ImpA family N-terminal domain-containing protein [Pseudomonas mandelii]
MTALFEMRVRVGGDPRDFAEFAAIRDELAKLSHPACPDVDWGRVEQLCLTLFQQHGADLQTAAALALARGHRYGLDGVAQGIELIEGLVCEWPTLWPPVPSVRLDILGWLFTQLQWLLRSQELESRSLPALVYLANELEHLHQRLSLQVQAPLVTLQALRQQIDNLLPRLQGDTFSGAVLPLEPRRVRPALAMPVVILPASPMPQLKSSKRSIAFGVASLTVLIGLIGAVWWQKSSETSESFSQFFEPQQVTPAPVRLDSMSLFDAGSSTLKPGSTKVLINTLANIRAQPGWLIVIAGHTDASGNPEHNLQLSHARATAVRSWMQQMGDIHDSCFAVQGLASSQPIASNDTESGRAANRRVDISLVPQAGACG